TAFVGMAFQAYAKIRLGFQTVGMMDQCRAVFGADIGAVKLEIEYGFGQCRIAFQTLGISQAIVVCRSGYGAAAVTGRGDVVSGYWCFGVSRRTGSHHY